MTTGHHGRLHRQRKARRMLARWYRSSIHIYPVMWDRVHSAVIGPCFQGWYMSWPIISIAVITVTSIAGYAISGSANAVGTARVTGITTADQRLSAAVTVRSRYAKILSGSQL